MKTDGLPFVSMMKTKILPILKVVPFSVIKLHTEPNTPLVFVDGDKTSKGDPYVRAWDGSARVVSQNLKVTLIRHPGGLAIDYLQREMKKKTRDELWEKEKEKR